MTTQFTVSADWMKACGLGSAARTFDVIRVEHRVAPSPAYREFYVLDRDGAEWTVLAFRGTPVEPAETDIDPVTGLTFAEGRARAQALREGRFGSSQHQATVQAMLDIAQLKPIV